MEPVAQRAGGEAADRTRMPAVFIGHGSPMNALEENRFTAAWRAFGEDMPPPATNT